MATKEGTTQQPASTSPAPHYAAFVNDFDGKVSVARQFLAEGIEQGDVCVFVTALADRATWIEALSRPASKFPPNVELLSAREWMPARTLNSMRMAKQLWERVEQALESGRDFRVAFDMAWMQDTQADASQACHLEATWDHLISPEPRAHMLCVYAVREVTPAMVHAGLRTHSVVCLDGRCVPNPFFEAPTILEQEPALNECTDDPAVVEGMLQHLRLAA